MADENVLMVPCEDGTERAFEIVQSFEFEGETFLFLHSVEEDVEDSVPLILRYNTQNGYATALDDDEHERILNWLIQQVEAQEQAQADEQVEAVNVEGMSAEELFGVLEEARFGRHPFGRSEMGEEMQVVWQVIDGWRKPRFLVDARARKAYHFMDENEYLLMVTDEDIDWESLSGIDEEMVDRARRHYGGFPTNIRGFQDGVAEVEWQINPDGRYYADDDGFGMTSDREVSLYSYIDRTGRPLVKFSYVGDDLSRLDRMCAEALKR